MSTLDDVHKYNDDIALTDEDARHITERFQHCSHILVFPELIEKFKKYDDDAKSQKRRSRQAGLVAIALGLIALFGAAGEPLYHDLPGAAKLLIGLICAAAGVGSVVVGFGGVLYAQSKRAWLVNRLMCERLRQFHFQIIARQFSRVIHSMRSDQEKKQYLDWRRGRLEEFMHDSEERLISDLTAIIAGDFASDTWLHPLGEVDTKLDAKDQGNARCVFEAYEELRMRHQVRYANFKLRSGSRLLPLTALDQVKAFSGISTFLVVTLLFIHLFIASGLIWGQVPSAIMTLLHVIAIWAAIVVLGIRALEEGLAPGRELERYRHYSASVTELRSRYIGAAAMDEKVAIITAMEQLSFDEMCNFVRASEETRFVM